ncbi:MAG: indole-3-glycerol phosphate synthase TrpC [Bacteroidales bacterium]|nr:indole-3-glycerol phosphate synthase TrpC [Bacteroidales bacterium]
MRAPKPSLREALLNSPTGIIAEFKRRSPSKGWIKEDGRAGTIPLAYQKAGAAALSILTDKAFFAGHDRFIPEARESGVTLPILYKNFVIDEMQVYEAALCGASAILLIAACLSVDECRHLTEVAHSVGLEVLLEIHSDKELIYSSLPVECIGVNNRHLGTFVTDVKQSYHMAELLRERLYEMKMKRLGAAFLKEQESGHTELQATLDNDLPVLVSESGISDPSTISALREVGFRGFLIGETFMREEDPGAALQAFISNVQG